MPPSISPVRDLVTAYLAKHPHEHPALAGLLDPGRLPFLTMAAPSGTVPHIVGVHLYSTRDPYRQLGRLVHTLARRETERRRTP
ncbi:MULTISPECIES: hypothetical protein [unclassified Streptomyces]|uniref:hypothetical protein n=1 Tax=unclassified Streptomyces TaxID=2593676 RepID=UPI001655F0B5|nr:hypothetical protein [Streptomyces sp. CB02980]MCB8901186.1 hypothetical protein [Streptomyces sp. CB02980]